MTSEISGTDPSLIPVSPPPAGKVSNFVDPPSISWAARLSIYLTLPIMIVAFVLRSYVRFRNHQFIADDLLLILGVATAASYCGVLIAILNNDVYGRHLWDIPVSRLEPRYLEYAAAGGSLHNFSAMFTKVSLLTLYLRLFSVSRHTKLFIWGGIAVISTIYMSLTIAVLALWIPRKGDGGWGSEPTNLRMSVLSGDIFLALGFFSAISDFYVLVIPIVVISGLQLFTRKKVGLVCLFLTGLISCGCSIAGIVFRYKAYIYTVEDHFWHWTKAQLLCVVELNIGILCACIPVFSVLFHTIMQRAESVFSYLKERPAWRNNKEVDTTKTKVALQYQGILPQITSGTLTGLRSLFQRSGQSTSRAVEKTRTDSQELQFLELHSIDYDYHAHIGRHSHTASHKSLIPNHSQV